MKLNKNILNNIIGEEFDIEKRYKLYRTIYEIIHPTISKKNISSYKIVLDDTIFPVRVSYPEKVTKINQVIIYTHGNGYTTGYRSNYSTICKNLSKTTNSLVIAIDYEMDNICNHKEFVEKLSKTVKYIIDEIEKEKIKDISLMGDSLGANFTIMVNELNDLNIKKQVLISPLLSWDYNDNSKYQSVIENTKLDLLILHHLNELKTYFFSKSLDNKYIFTLDKEYKNQPKTLIITGNTDPLRDEGKLFADKLDKNCTYKNINFANHSFLLSNDKEIIDEFNNTVINFLNK